MVNVSLLYLRCFWFSESKAIHGYLCRVLIWCPSTMCLSFDTYLIRWLYAALLRFPHLSLVYHGLLCGVDVCWSSLDTHWPFMWLSVFLLQSESCPGLVTHLLVKMPPHFCVQFGCFFLRRLSSLSDTVPYFEFNAFFRHLKSKETIFAPFFVCMYMCSCCVCRVLSSFCPCYYSALLYSSCILCIPFSGANYINYITWGLWAILNSSALCHIRVRTQYSILGRILKWRVMKVQTAAQLPTS